MRAFGEPIETDDRLTHFFPTPAALAAADYSTIGLPVARVEAIRRLAQAVQHGELTFSGVVDSGATRLVLPPAVAGIALLASLGPDGILGGLLGRSLILNKAAVVVALAGYRS